MAYERTNTNFSRKYVDKIEDAETIKARFKANYIQDNLARNLNEAEYAPAEAPEITTPGTKTAPGRKSSAAPAKKTQTTTTKRRKIAIDDEEQTVAKGLAGSFGIVFTGIMVACAVLFLACLTNYISLNIQIGQKGKQVTNLRKQVAKAVNENDNYEMSINSKIDYNYIYNVATQELGMVYATSSQIKNYNHETGDYVVQYKDVD